MWLVHPTLTDEQLERAGEVSARVLRKAFDAAGAA